MDGDGRQRRDPQPVGSRADAGRQDEFFLDLGAQAFSDELTRLDIPHTLELFDGKHGGISYRYPGAIRQLVLSLRDP